MLLPTSEQPRGIASSAESLFVRSLCPPPPQTFNRWCPLLDPNVWAEDLGHPVRVQNKQRLPQTSTHWPLLSPILCNTSFGPPISRNFRVGHTRRSTLRLDANRLLTTSRLVKHSR